VHPGKEVEIFTDTQPKHAYHGKVGYVSPEAEFTPKSVDHPAPQLACLSFAGHRG